VAAPIIVVLCRLIQGFALGGEVGPSTAFLLEAAPPERRAFFVSMQFTSQNVAVLAAGTVGVILSSTLDAAALESWGWRAAMLLGTLVIPLGIILRNSLPETLHQAPQIASAPSAGGRPIAMRIIVLGMLLLSTGTIGTYTLNYLSTYAIATLGLPAQIAFGATMITGLAATVFNPIMGLLADRFGRRPVMLIAGLSRALIILPGFYWIGVDKSVAVFYLVAFILITAQTFTIGPGLVWLSESIPAHIRSSSVGTIYAVAISVFGGTTQVIAASLTSWLNDPMAPAYYWFAAAIIGAVAIYFTHETAPNLVPASKSRPLAQGLDGI
jgi:MFS family permease